MSGRLPIVSEARNTLPPAAQSASGALDHLLRVRGLQALRLAEWALHPEAFPEPLRRPSVRLGYGIYERVFPLHRRDAAANATLEQGKIANLRLAAQAFDGLWLSPGRPLSFWRVLGRVTAERGFRPGLEISAGCLVPSLGGGLCLLANGLFEMAARLGWKIWERHGHTQEGVPAPKGELWGLDATVFWPYVDLRISPSIGDGWLGLSVEADTLRLTVQSDRVPRERVELSAIHEVRSGAMQRNRILRRVTSLRTGRVIEETVIAENQRRLLSEAEQGRTCLSCGEEACVRREEHLQRVG